MSFLRWFVTGNRKTKSEQKISNHLEMVNIKMSIQKEARERFGEVYNKLTDKQKKIVDNHELEGFVFPTRGDWFDFKRYKCEELLK